MAVAQKVGEITVNGKQVSMFTPPHDEPDFMWVDIEELARAFLPKKDAKRMVDHARNFGAGMRRYSTARNGDRIVTIICHPMAQGFCGFIDQRAGKHVSREDDDMGPSCREYSWAAAKFESEHGKLNSIEDITHAFRNQGGKFMEGF